MTASVGHACGETENSLTLDWYDRAMHDALTERFQNQR